VSDTGTYLIPAILTTSIKLICRQSQAFSVRSSRHLLATLKGTCSCPLVLVKMRKSQ
jgi:hypothetical protein